VLTKSFNARDPQRTSDLHHRTAEGKASLPQYRRTTRGDTGLFVGGWARGRITISRNSRNTGWRIMKVLIKSAWESDESTKAAFAFLHANALAEAGHEVQIFLLGEAVNLMRNETMNSVTPVGWPPLSTLMQETIGYKIPLNI